MPVYAYLHCRPDDSPFYVGKGSGRRANIMVRKYNPYHNAIVNKYGKKNILIGKLECSSSDIAYQLEAGLIKCLQRSGIKLSNLNAGGVGAPDPSVETRRKLSESHKSQKMAPQTRIALFMANTGRVPTENQRRKIGVANKGKPGLRGIMSPNARAICGVHPVYGNKTWGTVASAAKELGLIRTNLARCLRRGDIVNRGKAKGWKFRYVK